MVRVELSRVLRSISKTVGDILSLTSANYFGVPDTDVVTVEHDHMCVPKRILPDICTAIGLLEFTLLNCQQAISLHLALEEELFLLRIEVAHMHYSSFGGGLCLDCCCIQHFHFLPIFTGG